ncbi:MAG: hypothetical protein Q9160_002991 [Pyrenula sp. 1 TL-2023]
MLFAKANYCGTKQMKSLAEQIADLNDPAPRDFDPESNDADDRDSPDADSAEENGHLTGREHYQTVGKSKLRNPTQPSLGKQYQASTVSRDRINASDQDGDSNRSDEEDEVRFSAIRGIVAEESSDGEEVEDDEDSELNGIDGETNEDGDEEIDSDEAFDENDSLQYKDFKFRGSKRKASRRAEVTDDENDGSDSDSLVEDTEMTDGTQSVEDDAISETSSKQTPISSPSRSPSPSYRHTSKPKRLQQEPNNRSTLRSLLSSTSTNKLASTLSAAAASDVQKGRAVKQQYETFEKLLDIRIKLQKALTATNDLPREPRPTTASDPEVEETIRSAEQAALNLFKNLSNLRTQFLNATISSNTTHTSHLENREDQPPKKRRKLPIPEPADPSTPSSILAAQLSTLHAHSTPHRRSILQKWSLKTQPASSATTTTPSSKLLPNSSSTQKQDLLSHLDATILSGANSSQTQTQTPPASSSTPSFSLPTTDTAFYTSLLRDLISHRQSQSQPSSLAPQNPLPTKLHPSSSKNKPPIDTKASKGRKIRYTVHEKLVNWMPGGDERGSWAEDARAEFFAGLLGQKGMLREGGVGEVGGQGGEDGDGADGEMAGGRLGEGRERLRLFR